MGLGTIFSIVAGIWLAMAMFVTEVELASAAADVEKQIATVQAVHLRDQTAVLKVVNSVRIDSIEREIYNINEEIDDNELVGRKLGKRQARITELGVKKQNIIDGKE